MKKSGSIPDIVIERLPRYYRYLRSQLGKQEKISSRILAEHLSASASQVRHDLSYFGGFGLQGYGYRVEDLCRKIGRILGVEQDRYYVIVGAGSLGKAIANYPIFSEVGFHLSAVFDRNPEIIGSPLAGGKIGDVSELGKYLEDKSVDIVVITAPAEAAQGIADITCGSGCNGILNFAPVDLQVPENVQLRNIHLTDMMLALSYRLQRSGVVD